MKVTQDVLDDPQVDGKDFQVIIQSGEEEASMKVIYNYQINYNGINVFKNGNAVVVSSKNYLYKQGTPFVIEFQGNNKTLYTISHRLLPITNVSIREIVNFVLNDMNQLKTCFILNEITISNTNTLDILNVLSYTRNAYVYIISVKGYEIKGTFIDSSN